MVGVYIKVIILAHWLYLQLTKTFLELKKNLTDSLVIHVVGNKSDLAATQRAVPLKRTQEYVARALGAETPVHEVSAKDDNGTIEELFLQITRTLVERKHSGGGGKKDSNVIIPAPQPKPSNSCCW